MIFLVAIGDTTGMINVYDTLNLTRLNSFAAHSNHINHIMPLSNGLVASCSDDSTVKIWDLKTNWSLTQIYNGHSSLVHGLEYLSQDGYVASGSVDGTIHIWSPITGSTLRIINTNISNFCLKLLSNGVDLAAGQYGNISIYNINTGSLVVTLEGHSLNVWDLVLVNNELLASSGVDHTIRLWNLTTYKMKFILTGHADEIYCLKIVNSYILVSGSRDNMIKLWDIVLGTFIRTLEGHTNIIFWSIDFLNDGQTLLSGSADGFFKFWDWNTGQLLNNFNTGINMKTLSVLNVAKGMFVCLLKKAAYITNKVNVK